MIETQMKGVIFALYDGEKIQLEKRLQEKAGLKDFIIVLGGGIEGEEDEETALKREIFEEYGIGKIIFFKKIGVVAETGNVYLVTNWIGEPKNPEKDQQKSIHIEATLGEARVICKHPITQQILDLIDNELSR